MESWLTYPEYAARYPGTTLTEPEFSTLAEEAAQFILGATRWAASLADEAEQLQRLRDCQASLVHLSAEAGSSWDGVASVSNHGYTESYASGMDRQAYLGARQQQVLERTLSAPETRWMLYPGAVYRTPRRR